MKFAAEKTAEKLANAIRSGSMRPRENGAAHSTGGVLFDYRSATKSQREDLKRRIRLAAARGEKIFPK